MLTANLTASTSISLPYERLKEVTKVQNQS